MLYCDLRHIDKNPLSISILWGATLEKLFRGILYTRAWADLKTLGQP